MIGSLLLSGHLAGERTESFRSAIARQSAASHAQLMPEDQKNIAREIHEIRKHRIDWSPKLSALQRRIGPSLVLEELVGQVAQLGGPARLSMKGKFAATVDAIEGATDFLKGLRTDPAFQSSFPSFRLGKVQGEGERGFEVICESTPEGL